MAGFDGGVTTLVTSFNATGDLLVGTGDDTSDVLSIGDTSNILTIACGTAAWTASPSLTDLTLTGGDITLSAATDIDLLDNNASALSFDATAKTGILELVTTDCSEGVKMSGTLAVTGIVTVGGSCAQAGELRILEDSDAGSHYVAIKAQNMGGNYTLTLPADDGCACEVLTTNGSGTLTWAAASGGSGPGVCGCPADNQVAIWAACEELEGRVNLTFDGTTLTHSATGATASILARYSGDGYAPEIQFKKSRGTSIGAFDAIQSGDNLGRLRWYGADGDSLESGAYIEVMAGATWSASNRQTYMDTYVTPSGCSTTNTLTTRLTSDGQLRLKDGSASAPAVSFLCDTNTGMYTPSADEISFATGGTERLRIKSMTTFINDTAHGEVGTGLVINQLTEDAQPTFVVKSSDVNTSLTSLPGQYDVETDDYFAIGKAHVSHGGAHFKGMSSSITALDFQGFHGNMNPSNATCGYGTFNFTSWMHNGSNGNASMESGGNIFTIGVVDNGSGATRFIFDHDGAARADSSWGCYDEYCDIQLLHGMRRTLAPNYEKTYVEKFGDDMIYNQKLYEDLDIVGKGSVRVEHRHYSGKCELRGMVNYTKLAQLHHSAIIQLADKVDARLNALEAKLQLGDGNGDNI